MPVSSRSPLVGEPDRLRPYTFHGLRFSSDGAATNHQVADCPFCGREGKFSADVPTGLWRCLVCGTGTAAGGGNALVFIRLLYERAVAATPPAERDRIAQDRRLLSPDTVAAWGVCVDPGRTWLIPGYGPDGKLDQVYRRVRMREKDQWVWRLLPTPGLWTDGKAHKLHLPTGDFDPARPNLVICEGPWDGMALWEVWDRTAADTNIIAVPGCNVWCDEWTQMCRGKYVTVMFDSDHPHETVPGSGRTSRAGYDGIARVARRLSGVAATVRYINWGPGGYDASKPSGWDVRDHLTTGQEVTIG